MHDICFGNKNSFHILSRTKRRSRWKNGIYDRFLFTTCATGKRDSNQRRTIQLRTKTPRDSFVRTNSCVLLAWCLLEFNEWNDGIVPVPWSNQIVRILLSSLSMALAAGTVPVLTKSYNRSTRTTTWPVVLRCILFSLRTTLSIYSESFFFYKYVLKWYLKFNEPGESYNQQIVSFTIDLETFFFVKFCI